MDERDRATFARQLRDPQAVPIVSTVEVYARLLGFDPERIDGAIYAHAMRADGPVENAWVRRRVEAASAADASLRIADKRLADRVHDSMKHTLAFGDPDEDWMTAGTCAAIALGSAMRFSREAAEAETTVHAIALALCALPNVASARTIDARPLLDTSRESFSLDEPIGSPLRGLREAIEKRDRTLAAVVAEYQAKKAAGQARAAPPTD